MNGYQGIAANEVNNAQTVANPYMNDAQFDLNASQTALMPTYSPYAQFAGTQEEQATGINLPQAYSPYAQQSAGEYAAAAGTQMGAAGQQLTAPAEALYQGTGNGLSADTIAQYESPYTQQVVNATQAQFNNQNAQQQQGVIGNAVSSGAWGGDRSAVAQALTAGQEQLAQAPVIAGLENQGYSQALGEANTQQQMQQQAAAGIGQLANTQLGAWENQAQNTLAEAQGLQGIGATMLGANEAQAQNLLSGANLQNQIGSTALGASEAQDWLASQGSYGESALGNSVLNSGLTAANAEMGIGQEFQQQQQAELNAPYEQELAQQAYPFQTTQWLANIAEGIGGASGGTSSTTSPGPSTLSQLGGLGLTSAALIGGTGGFGATGWLTSLLAARGGNIPRRAGGGIVPGVPLGGIAGGIPGQGSGIPGVVSIVPNSAQPSVGHMGIPKPPQAAQNQSGMSGLSPQSVLGTFKQTGAFGPNGWANFGGRGQNGSDAGMPVPPIPPDQIPSDNNLDGPNGGSGEWTGGGIAGRAVGGFIHQPMIPHIPRLQGMGGIGSHAVHPPGVPRLDVGGGIVTPSQEIMTQQQAQDNAQALALASAEASMTLPTMTPTGTTSGSARGGGIGYADGGGVDDADAALGSASDSPVTITGASDADLPVPPIPPPGGAGGTGHHGSDADMPVPPIPPPGGAPPLQEQQGAGIAAGPPSPPGGGIAGDQPHTVDTSVSAKAPPSPGSNHKGAMNNSDIWMTLLGAGLGIMGGRSPYAAVNIGQGGLEGLKFGQELANTHATQQLRQSQQEANDQYRQGLLADKSTGRTIQQQRADTDMQYKSVEAMQKQAQAALETARAANVGASKMNDAELKAQVMKGLIGQPSDPNDPNSKPITQMDAYRLAQGFDIRQKNADTAAARQQTSAQMAQQRIDAINEYRQWQMNHGDATAAETRAWHDTLRDKGVTDENIRVLEGSKNAAGVITQTPQQANETRQQLSPGNGGGPASAAVTPPKFENGKMYVDGKGNRAVYQNGKWVPVGGAPAAPSAPVD